MIAWSPSLIDAHCSSWTIIQTLEWFNGTDLKWMKKRQGWRLPLARSAAYLLDRAQSDGRPVDQAERLPDVQSALDQSYRWLRDEALRYCPTCVQIGRHYQYQQDDRFVRCVLHKRRLKTGCPQCGAPLDTKGCQVHGFTCGACEKTLLRCSVPGAMNVSKSTSQSRILDALQRWLADASDSLNGHQRAFSGTTAICWRANHTDNNAGEYWHALIKLPSSVVGDALVPTPASFRHVPATPLLLPLPAGDHEAAIRPYQELLRCIARHIRRVYLRGHAGCRNHAMTTVGGTHVRMQRWTPVTIRPHLCCVGQAYAIWLLQRREELLEICQRMSVNAFTESEHPVRLPALPAAAASYISSFEAWIANLARLQSLVRRSNRQPMLCEPFIHSSHWALHQPGTSWSCPTHLRFDGWRGLGRCDKGRIREEDRELLNALGLHRQ